MGMINQLIEYLIDNAKLEYTSGLRDPRLFAFFLVKQLMIQVNNTEILPPLQESTRNIHILATLI